MIRTSRALALVALLGLSACTASSGGGGGVPAASGPATSSVGAAGSRAPAGHKAVNPLTGVGAVPKTPLVAVKMDDTAPGRPQVGIDKADIVYIEAVEAGYTRLAALFGTNKPMVGYVRSTRPSDPDLLRQYGKITEAFSGGQDVSRNVVHKAGLTAWNFGAGRPGYHRVNRSESDYINLELDLAQVAKTVRTPRPTGNGWRFSRSLAGLRTARGTDMKTIVTGSYDHGTAVEFRWNPKLGKYVRYIDGTAQHAADGNLVTATNVVVQSCRVASFSADRDVNGYPAQFTTTIGSGAVSVFRQGKRLNGTWSRRNAASGTALRTADHKSLPLNPGNTWVVLIRKGITVTG